MSDHVAKKKIIGVLIDPTDYPSAADRIFEAARQQRGYAVSALAVHGVMTGALDATHRFRLNQFDLLVPDGQPVRWALNLLHHAKLKERVYGPQLTLEVLARAAHDKVPVYFYGTTPEILASFCEKVRGKFPGIQIAGAEPSKFSRVSAATADEIATRIKQSGARIVFAGLGCPRQEVWAYEFRGRLSMPVLAVGAAFPFIAGTLSQAPRWMQDCGLEWLFRLWHEPFRLWRRYLFLNPAYVAMVACQWMGFRFSDAGKQPSDEMLYG